MAESCEFCGKFNGHQDWCISCNDAVFYAWAVLTQPERLTKYDRAQLQEWGVTWGQPEGLPTARLNRATLRRG